MVSGGVVRSQTEAVPFEAVSDSPSSTKGSLREPCPGETIVPARPKCLMNASGRPSNGVCVAFMFRKLVEVNDRKLAGCESS